MKLSEIKGERTFDVIAEIVPPIANIANSPEARALVGKKQLPAGETPDSFAIKRLKESLPALLKAHKQDIIAILAAIKGVKPEEYANSLDLASLFLDCTDLLSDEAFGDLFQQAQTDSSSTSAPTTLKVIV